MEMDLLAKCKELGGLAGEVLKNPNQHTPGFIAESQEVLTRTQQLAANLTTPDSGMSGALAWGAGGALIGSKFGPWGTAIGGVAGAIGGYVGHNGTPVLKEQSAGVLNEYQSEMDMFESALKGESGSGAAEREENTALLDAEKKSEEDIPILDTQVITDANALKALQPRELGEKFATDFYGYYRKACLPLVNKAKAALGSGMGAKTNVEINKYIAEAQFNMEQADKLAGTYITNIDEYHTAMKPTIENKDYDGKFGSLVKKRFHSRRYQNF